jgi:hypothetical protein
MDICTKAANISIYLQSKVLHLYTHLSLCSKIFRYLVALKRNRALGIGADLMKQLERGSMTEKPSSFAGC